MITRDFKLYLNAGVGVAPVINANQFDKSEEWVFTLLQSDGTVYTPSTGAIIGLKQDGTTILNAGTVNSDGQVVITETEQITAVPGSNLFEILIDGNTHGTANFVVFVERRPGDIDNPSESDISLFQEAITAAGNVTQFQADISALQSGLTQEAQTRQAQDASLASQIAQEASTRQTQDAVLQAEIDQIIAPSGEAPSAAEVQNARIGLDGTTYDTLGDAIRGQVSDLKNDIDGMDTVRFADLPYYVGNLGTNGTWNQIGNANYKHKVIPVSPNDEILIGFSGLVLIAFVKSYTVPSANGDVIDYSSASGFTGRMEIGTNIRQFIVPADVNYLIIENYRNNGGSTCLKLSVNGYDFAVSLNQNIRWIKDEILDDQIFLAFEIGAINTTTGEDTSSTTRVRTPFINALDGVRIVSRNVKTRICGYDASGNFISAEPWAAKNNIVYYPQNNITQIRLMIGYTDDSTIRDANLVTAYYSAYKIVNDDNTPLCYGIGDSILQGYYSYVNGGADAITTTPNCWVNLAMAELKHRFVNYGVGGSGFVHAGTVLDRLNAKDHVDTIDFSAADYVIVAYGVNDWKYNMPLGTIDSVSGDGTIYGNMKYVIEKIIADNPLCKIFVVTPLNSANTSKDYGTEATNWGLGYRLSNSGTLEDVFQAEKDVAEYYGIQLIDQTHSSIVNRKNLLTVLTDGVHPSYSCHGVIGKEMPGKITFK